MKTGIDYLILFFLLISSYSCLYFEIKGDKEKCFVDEFSKQTVVVITYQIYGIDITEEANLKLIESIQIKFIKEENRELISRHIIRTFSGKFSFTVDQDGTYKICAQNVVYSWLGDNKVFMTMKIENDTTDEINLHKVIKTEDINPVTEKINKIINKAQNIIQKQSLELASEDEAYINQQNYSKTLIYFTVFQILIVALIGMYHLYSFHNFLISNKVINI